MGIGTSIFLLALGAILKFAVSDSEIAGIDIATVGVILIIAGILGLLISLFLLTQNRGTTGVVAHRDRVVERDRIV